MRCAALLLLWASLAQAEAPRRFALVVGNNAPLAGSGYEPLRYADDDALRFARLMTQLGAHVELLTTPDRETIERFGSSADRARPPRRAELSAALTRLEAALAATPSPREVYVYFSGHGSVTGADAYLHLLDGPFHRTDLHAQILARLPRERVHVIIDSCHAYFLVNARGRVPARTDDEDLSRYPDAGFLLSTADRREVHEWSGYRGGVFTYQVLGALHGAADLDLDGVVTYLEAHAYVAAANMAVENPRARIRPFVRRPRVRLAPLIDLRAQDRAVVPAELSGRLRVRDHHGFPHLDAHKPARTELALLTPTGQASLQVDDRHFALAGGGRFVASPAEGSGAVASRGSLDDDFRKNLFRQPLTAEFVAGFDAASRGLAAPAAAPPRAWTDDPLTVTLGATGLAAVAAGGVFTALFLDARDEADARPVTDATADARDRAEGWRTAMAVGFGVGATLVTAAILNAAFDRTEPPAGAVWGPHGLGLGGRF